MRARHQGASLAENLNEALSELHSLKLQQQREREQLQQLSEQNQRLRLKCKDLRRQKEPPGEEHEISPENEQTVGKIRNYLSRMQQSSSQMCQIARQCSTDREVQVASCQIQRNMVKATSGVAKHLGELIRRWGGSQKLRLQNQRLEVQNKKLFQLTSTLQHNFKDTDRLLRQLPASEGGRERINELEEENARLRIANRSNRGNQLEEKVRDLVETVSRLEQENTTIKNIHQMTMKKLEALEEKEELGDGQGLQEERQRWLQKTDQLYQQNRQLQRKLKFSQENELKVQEELNRCLQIYTHWEEERDLKKQQIEELKAGVATYLDKIEDLEGGILERNDQIDRLRQRIEVGEGEKDKIISVYQLEAQQLNDQMFQKQDAIAQLKTLLQREQKKIEKLSEQIKEGTKKYQTAELNLTACQQDLAETKKILAERDERIGHLEETIVAKEEEIVRKKEDMRKLKLECQLEITQITQQKEEIAEIMQQFRDQYCSLQKDIERGKEEVQAHKAEFRAVHQQLSSIMGNHNSLDLWQLLATIRSKFTAALQENKALKEMQARMFQEAEARENQLRNVSEKIREEVQNQQSAKNIVEQLEVKIATLQMANLKHQENILELQLRIEGERKRVSSLLSQNKELKGNKQVLEDRLNEKKSFCEELGGEVEGLKCQVEKMKVLEREWLQKEKDLVKQIKEVTKERQLSPQELNCQSKIQQKSDEIDKEAQGNLSRLREEINSLRHRQNQRQERMKALSEENIQYQQVNTQLTEELNTVYNQRFKFITKIESLQAQVAALEKLQEKSQLSEISNEEGREELRKMVEAEKQTARHLEETLILKSDQLEETKCQLKTTYQDLYSAQIDVQKARHERDTLLEDVQSLKEKEIRWMQQLDSLIIEKQTYANRLGQIEEILEEFKSEEGQSVKLRGQLDALAVEKERCDQANKQLRQNASKMKNEIKQLRDECERLKGDCERLRKTEKLDIKLEESQATVDVLERERVEHLKQIHVLQKAQEEIKRQVVVKREENQQLKFQLGQIQEAFSQREKELQQLKSVIKLCKQEEEERSQLLKNLQTYRLQNAELIEEVGEISKKYQCLKSKWAGEESLREQLEEDLKLKARQLEALEKENNHYKAEIKRVSREKVIAENQAAKHKCHFEEQISSFKLRESQATTQGNQQTMRDLKRQIQALRESNSQLQQQTMSNRSRKTDSMLSSNQHSEVPVEMLKGELKSKSMSIQHLEKQLKSKTEEYSKLERKVQSLSDELNLQKRRVKNFEGLYENIQSKKLRLLQGE